MKTITIAAVLGAALPRAAAAKEVFACNMNGLTADERAHHRQLTERLLHAVQQKVELPDGYGFRLERSLLGSATEWVGLESKCCPFFTFQLELERHGGALWLRLTGADGVKPFIREEFAR